MKVRGPSGWEFHDAVRLIGCIGIDSSAIRYDFALTAADDCAELRDRLTREAWNDLVVRTRLKSTTCTHHSLAG